MYLIALYTIYLNVRTFYVWPEVEKSRLFQIVDFHVWQKNILSNHINKWNALPGN